MSELSRTGRGNGPHGPEGDMMETMTNDQGNTVDRQEPFPVNWNEWRKVWDAWRAERGHLLHRSSYQWPGKNFLADEILWRGSLRYANGTGRQVELSEVTFPALGERPARTERMIGITYGTSGGTDIPDRPLVRTFAELEEELNLSEAV